MTTKKQNYYYRIEKQDWTPTEFKHYVFDQQFHENYENPKNPKLFTFEELFTFIDLPEEKREKFQKTYNRLVKTNWIYWVFQTS